MTRREVCSASELSPGDRRIVEVDGREIGVFNVDGEYFALLNRCAHQGGPVCEGEVAREMSGSFVGPTRPIEETYTEKDTILCPWHQWSYDIRSGEHTGDGSTRIPTFPVEEEAGTLYLDV